MQPDRHDSAVGSTADRTIDTDEPRRTPVARPDEPAAPRFSGEGAGGCGELDGGCGLHTPTIMTKGYPRVRRGSGRPGLAEPAQFPETRARGTTPVPGDPGSGNHPGSGRPGLVGPPWFSETGPRGTRPRVRRRRSRTGVARWRGRRPAGRRPSGRSRWSEGRCRRPATQRPPGIHRRRTPWSRTAAATR